MTGCFKNYRYQGGKPFGVDPISDDEPSYYKILTDPYHKRYSVELYEKGQFARLAYDSALFDFRQLKDPRFIQWRREELLDGGTILRNGEDRIVLKEQFIFQTESPYGTVSRECHLFHPNGPLIGQQKIYYQPLGDSWNGTVLYDREMRPVLLKKYALLQDALEFGELLEISWEPANCALIETVRI